jgi:hypothetical protein
MSFRPGRNQSSGLTIHPPSPSIGQQNISTPTNLYHSNPLISSPRRAPLPPSPTHSTTSSTTPWFDDRVRGGSFDVPRGEYPPPLPSKTEKRLPLPPGQAPLSPHRNGRGGYVGAYDNKLVSPSFLPVTFLRHTQPSISEVESNTQVSSTLSQLPPLPPLSPTPTGTSSISHNSGLGSGHLSSAPLLKTPSGSAHSSTLASVASRPSFSQPSSSSGIVVLPDGTALATSGGDHHDRHTDRGDIGIGLGRSIIETMAHSSPSSPWSLLTVHVLPLFAGGALKTPIEDLK